MTERGEPERDVASVNQQPGERARQGWCAPDCQVEQGERRDRSRKRLDMEVQAGLPVKHGMRSREGEAQAGKPWDSSAAVVARR